MEWAALKFEFSHGHERQPSFACYPKDLDASYCQLASHGANLQTLNLFLFGRDLPHWIMKNFIFDGYTFCN